MTEIEVGEEVTLTAPAGATSVDIFHEWESETPEGNYSVTAGVATFTPSSIGVHKFVWDTGKIEHRVAVVRLVAPDAGLTGAELEAFIANERLARFIIEGYTGQKFGPYHEKELTLQGDDGDSLVLPLRLTSFTSIIDNDGIDITEQLQVSHSNDEIIQGKPGYRGGAYDFDTKRDISAWSYDIFSHRKDFSITGNWGWEYVPPEVSQAAELLIASFSGGEVAEMRASGIYEAQLGDFSLKLNADQWGTTGNVQADQLLSRYISYGIELI